MSVLRELMALAIWGLWCLVPFAVGAAIAQIGRTLLRRMRAERAPELNRSSCWECSEPIERAAKGVFC
jgi:hypothetical protein